MIGVRFTFLTCGARVRFVLNALNSFISFGFVQIRSDSLFAFKFVHQTPPRKTQKPKTNPSDARCEPNGVVIESASDRAPLTGRDRLCRPDELWFDRHPEPHAGRAADDAVLDPQRRRRAVHRERRVALELLERADVRRERGEV